MILLLIAFVIYIGYSIYMNARKKRAVDELTNAIHQAQTVAEENNRKFDRILERLDQIPPEEFDREYFFEKDVLGQTRMFSAPIHYNRERQVFVISAADALNYERQLAFAYPNQTLNSALEATLHVNQKDTNLPKPNIDVNNATNRRFPYEDNRSTQVARA